jgi:hypothetical protein
MTINLVDERDRLNVSNFRMLFYMRSQLLQTAVRPDDFDDLSAIINEDCLEEYLRQAVAIEFIKQSLSLPKKQ